MEILNGGRPTVIGSLGSFMRKCIFSILSIGPIPSHIAFIMDGNRRFAKKEKLQEGDGHRAGFLALVSILKHCYMLGVKYVSAYAFSIDNFKRRPHEVQYLMDLILETTEGFLKEESIVNAYGIGVHFVGNLKLLSEPVRVAAEKVMRATSKNTRCVLFICIAYTSSNEIVHAVQESCKDKFKNKACNDGVGEIEGSDEMVSYSSIKVVDIEKKLFLATAPDPDMLVRSSGSNRLSNFLLWQASNCSLYAPQALWPEIGVLQLVWTVIIFQRNRSYLERKKKQF